MTEHDESGAVREIRPAHGLVGVWWNWRLRNAEENARMMAGTIELQERTMAPQPQRRENRKTHLDASVVPVERALLARAHEMSSGAMQAFAILGPEREDGTDVPARIEPNLKLMMAAEFRNLAEELHYW